MAAALFMTAAGVGQIQAAGETIGYSSPFLFSQFQVILQDQAGKAATGAGLNMLEPTNADGDSGKQITDVRSLIGAGAKGLIVVANDSKAIIPALDFAAEQKVPVVSIDIGPDGGSLYAIVRADKRGNRYVLNGGKHWITGGGVSRLHLIFAKVYDENGVEEGIGGFIAIRDETEGLKIVKREPTMGLRGIPEAEIAFDLVKRAAWVLPVAVIFGAMGWGTEGMLSAAYAILIVCANYLLSAFLMSQSAKISLGLLMGAAMFGFLIRMALILAAVWVVKDAWWLSPWPFGITLIATHLGLLPQGQAERTRRAVAMVERMDLEGFGGCTNFGECHEACPKEIPLETIARLNRDFMRASKALACGASGSISFVPSSCPGTCHAVSRPVIARATASPSATSCSVRRNGATAGTSPSRPWQLPQLPAR